MPPCYNIETIGVIIPKTYEESRKYWLIQYNRRKAKKWYQENKEETHIMIRNI